MSVKYFLLPKVQSQYTLKGNQYQCLKFDVEVTTKTAMIIGSTCELHVAAQRMHSPGSIILFSHVHVFEYCAYYMYLYVRYI